MKKTILITTVVIIILIILVAGLVYFYLTNKEFNCLLKGGDWQQICTFQYYNNPSAFDSNKDCIYMCIFK